MHSCTGYRDQRQPLFLYLDCLHPDCRKLQPVEQFFRSKAVQVVDNAVVVHDAEFIFRKQDGKEIVEFLFSYVVRILLSAEFSHTDSGGTAVMPVCDVNAVDAGKGRPDSSAVIGI